MGAKENTNTRARYINIRPSRFSVSSATSASARPSRSWRIESSSLELAAALSLVLMNNTDQLSGVRLVAWTGSKSRANLAEP